MLVGYTDEYIEPYIPAIVFTLYDGYYIYSPTYADKTTTVNGEEITEEDVYEHSLKPYIYYTARYSRDINYDFVVNYTLDNYMIVYGKINGQYQTNSGYLISPDNVELNISDRQLKELEVIEIERITNSLEVKYTNENGITVDIDDSLAKAYYAKAKKFSLWVRDNLGNIQASEAVKDDGIRYTEFQNNDTQIFNINANNNPEELNSAYAQHRIEIIRISIQTNLNAAIARYNENSEGLNTTYNFKMPILDDYEWEKITSNVCMVTFMQGIPVGMKSYNNYCVMPSGKNKEKIDVNNLYFLSDSGSYTDYYHRIDCEYLGTENIRGYKNIDFDVQKDENTLTGETTYSFIHGEKLACYHCIVDNNNLDTRVPLNLDNIERIKAYYEALGREKDEIYKTNQYLRGVDPRIY